MLVRPLFHVILVSEAMISEASHFYEALKNYTHGFDSL